MPSSPVTDRTQIYVCRPCGEAWADPGYCPLCREPLMTYRVRPNAKRITYDFLKGECKAVNPEQDGFS